MEKRLLTYQQPELKQTSRVQNNETRPALTRSKTYNDKKITTNNNSGNNFNKQNRFNNRFRNKGQNDDVSGNHNRSLSDKAELNNEDINDEDLVLKKKGMNNLNHLLNFKFLRQEPYHVYEKEFKTNSSFTKTNISNIFTKETFLQANCQFLVNNQGDYSTHFQNPDTLVDWYKIEQVLLRSHQQISCPICLYPPIAGRITKCGHIYCLPCILNYLALGENKWRKCPICFDSIYKDDLKSVRILKINEYKVGDKIELNLMFKEKSSTLIYPLNLFKLYEQNKPTCLNDFSNYKDYNECKKYLKMQTIDSNYVNKEILERETNELINELKSDDCAENVKFYINESLSLIEKRERIKTPAPTVFQFEEPKIVESTFKTSNIKPTVHYKDAFDLTIDDDVESEENVVDDKIKVQSSENEEEEEETVKNSPTGNTFYSHFYQAEDGQRIYLNSLNLRCLIHEYKQIENCPLKIEAKIVAIENMFMNNELRKRFRYLAHIPLHSEFQIVELDLKEPILSEATIAKFEQQIRYKANKRKEKEDKERKMERKNLLKMNTFSHGNYIETTNEQFNENVQDYNQAFPNITPSNAISIHDKPDVKQQQSSTSSSSYTSELASSINDSLAQNQVSFAQKLKIETAKNVVEEWPTLMLKNDTSMSGMRNSLSMNFSQSCKANPPKQSINKVNNNQVATINDSNDESESLASAPTYQLSFMTAIDAAFQNLELKSKPKTENKKKKKTKNLLFST